MEKEVISSINERTQPFVNEWLEEAIAYAVRMHRGAVRKGTVIPYIVHPLEVMNTLLIMGADMALVAAGVLHDTVEDTEATLEDIAKNFGREVADLVASHTEMDKSLPWRERKEIALEHLAKASKREQMLVLADKLSNIEAMARDFDNVGDALWDRFNKGRDEQEWYYREAVKAMSKLGEELDVMQYYHRFVGAVDYVFDQQNNAYYFYQQLEKLFDENQAEHALRQLDTMAKCGHVGAMIALAEAYQGTPTIEANLEESFNWWKLAAKTGNPIAQYNFGKCFENGRGVEVDTRQALVWYLKAAEQGCVEAMNDIGIYYAQGIEVEKSEEEAFFWFKKACENENDAGALYNLAKCYEIGFGTEVDLVEAKRLEKLADKLLAEDQEDNDWKIVGEPENLEENYN